jgi:hypothetical protein
VRPCARSSAPKVCWLPAAPPVPANRDARTGGLTFFGRIRAHGRKRGTPVHRILPEARILPDLPSPGHRQPHPYHCPNHCPYLDRRPGRAWPGPGGHGAGSSPQWSADKQSRCLKSWCGPFSRSGCATRSVVEQAASRLMQVGPWMRRASPAWAGAAVWPVSESYQVAVTQGLAAALASTGSASSGPAWGRTTLMSRGARHSLGWAVQVSRGDELPGEVASYLSSGIGADAGRRLPQGKGTGSHGRRGVPACCRLPADLRPGA